MCEKSQQLVLVVFTFTHVLTVIFAIAIKVYVVGQIIVTGICVIEKSQGVDF